jgi:hypothetical protein
VTVTPIEGLDLLEVAPAVIRVDVSRGSTGSPLPTTGAGATSVPAASAAPGASVAP